MRCNTSCTRVHGNVAGGYYSTAGDDPSILLRMKEDYDGAEPAASSIAVSNLLRLSALAAPEEAERLRGCGGCSAFQTILQHLFAPAEGYLLSG